MLAIHVKKPGGPEEMVLTECETPKPGPGQLLVKVCAAGVNRADILQRKGYYPPPPGAPETLGLEISGEVSAIGQGVSGFPPGKQVCGLVSGGGYAQYCLLDAEMALPLPSGWNHCQAAALPEVFMTANETLFKLGKLGPDQWVCIHAGASGVGSAAIQLAKAAGARVITTVGSAEKANFAQELGADETILYKQEDIEARVMAATSGLGVPLIIDFVGAKYLEMHQSILAECGRLICVGLLGGAKSSLNLGMLINKRQNILGFVMRKRSIHEKVAILERFQQRWWSAVEKGSIKTLVHKTFPLAEAAEAHAYMEASHHMGKLILEPW